QSGEAGALERITEIHRAPVVFDLLSKQSGVISKMDAGAIGRACVQLGAGRQKAGDAIDFAVGCSAIKKVGGRIEKNEPLLRIHARDETSLQAALPLFKQAVAITNGL